VKVKKKNPAKNKVSLEKKYGNSTSKYLPLTQRKPPGTASLSPTHPPLGVSKKITCILLVRTNFLGKLGLGPTMKMLPWSGILIMKN